MADIGVTTNTGNGCLIGFHRLHVMHNVLVTFATRVFGDTKAAILDLDRVVKFTSGKGERMKESMLRFGEILGNKSRRRMTVVAGRDGPMARLDPAIKMVLHDVAVGTGFGVITQVGRTFRIDKGVAPDTRR